MSSTHSIVLPEEGAVPPASLRFRLQQHILKSFTAREDLNLESGVPQPGQDVSTYIFLLRDCWNIIGPLPATAGLVKRLHEVASTESDPYPFDDLTGTLA